MFFSCTTATPCHVCCVVKLANRDCVASQSVLLYSIPVNIRPSHFSGRMGLMHVRTRRGGVHHGCVCRYREVRSEAWLLVSLDGRVHLHAVIQGLSPTGLQGRARERQQSEINAQRVSGGHRERGKCPSPPTCMRKSLALVSMYLLSKKAKTRDKKTAFPSAPNTQPSSPWEDSTARKQSLTGLRLSAAHATQQQRRRQ